MSKLFFTISFLFTIAFTFGQGEDSISRLDKKLIFSDDFETGRLNDQWTAEINEKDAPGFLIKDGQLHLDTEGGITLWYKKILEGNILIEYDRAVLMEDKKNDRLSDLNQFWMVTDPQQKMFQRKGGFREYDSLRMYYVGMGGNYNSTTRMRRYDGKADLKIIAEYKDSAHLLVANKTYHIIMLVKDGLVKFIVDGQTFFSFKDDQPLSKGWFAIRSTKSRQVIDNVKIWQLN